MIKQRSTASWNVVDSDVADGGVEVSKANLKNQLDYHTTVRLAVGRQLPNASCTRPHRDRQPTLPARAVRPQRHVTRRVGPLASRLP